MRAAMEMDDTVAKRTAKLPNSTAILIQQNVRNQNRLSCFEWQSSAPLHGIGQIGIDDGLAPVSEEIADDRDFDQSGAAAAHGIEGLPGSNQEILGPSLDTSDQSDFVEFRVHAFRHFTAEQVKSLMLHDPPHEATMTFHQRV